MNLDRIIGELRGELTALDEALLVLERLARTHGRRRGRPPLTMASEAVASAPRKRRPFSAETRKKMAASQKKRWAAARKQQKAD